MFTLKRRDYKGAIVEGRVFDSIEKAREKLQEKGGDWFIHYESEALDKINEKGAES